MNRKILTLAFGTLLAVGTAANAHAQLVVRIGPPRPVHEVAPPPPHPGMVWQPGYHRWDGQRYVWVGGHYEQPPHEHARWVPGHWDHRGGGYVWVDGHWRG